MTRAEFIPQLAATLEAEPANFSETTILGDLPHWDSMRLLEVIVLLDDQLSISLNANQLSRCQTAGDILALIGNKLVN